MTNNKATVVRVITRLNIGGPARQAFLLTRELAPTHPTVLVAGTPPPDEGELVDPDVPVTRIPLVRPVRPVADALAVAAVRRILAQTRAPVLHTHTAKAGTVGRTAALAIHPRPRTVHTFHGHSLDGYFGRVTERAFLEVERRLARRTDVIVAVSGEVRDALLDLGVGRPSQYHVVSLGLDLAPFLSVAGPVGELRASLGLGSDVPLVGVVARLAPIKDHMTLLEAMAEIPGAHLAVIGDGELRDALERRAAEFGVSERVHFCGWLNDVASAVADLDVVVLTSRNEGTPVSLIEALAAARPVVATDVGGVRTVVRPGVTGDLVPAGEPHGVAHAIAELLREPGRRAAYGGAGREDVRERFGHERLVQEVAALYDDLLEPSPAAGHRIRRYRGGRR